MLTFSHHNLSSACCDRDRATLKESPKVHLMIFLSFYAVCPTVTWHTALPRRTRVTMWWILLDRNQDHPLYQHVDCSTDKTQSVTSPHLWQKMNLHLMFTRRSILMPRVIKYRESYPRLFRNLCLNPGLKVQDVRKVLSKRDMWLSDHVVQPLRSQVQRLQVDKTTFPHLYPPGSTRPSATTEPGSPVIWLSLSTNWFGPTHK